MSLSAPTAMPIMPDNSSLDALRHKSGDGIEAEKKRLAKVAQEFESLFIHQVMAAMRKTIPKNDMQGGGLTSGMGKDVFTDMFDMEMAKSIADGKPGSLAHALYKQMEKLIDASYSSRGPNADREIKPLTDSDRTSGPIELNRGRPQLPIEQERLAPMPDRSNQPAVHVEPPAVRQEKSLNDAEESRPTGRERWDPTIPLPDEPPPPKDPLQDVAQIRRAISGDSILNRFGHLIENAAAETKLDSALIYSVVKAESNGQPDAVSHAGAKGLMQLIDSTASDYGVRQVFDPAENIRGGSRYLRDLVEQYDGDLKLALAAYNAGPGNVKKYGGIPPFKETQQYVERVMSHYNAIRQNRAAHPAKVRR